LEQEEKFNAAPTDNVLQRLANSGQLPWDKIRELGEVATGNVQAPQGITVFRESQGGFGDLVFAQWIYQQANRIGRGQIVDFNG
jgi:ornithine cyclodeaminase/alanine dehydrogenase-like protein (mu-crystallin family)